MNFEGLISTGEFKRPHEWCREAILRNEGYLAVKSTRKQERREMKDCLKGKYPGYPKGKNAIGGGEKSISLRVCGRSRV